MNEWLLPIGAAALLAGAEIGVLLCTAALGVFAHMLLVGVVVLAAGAAVYRGRQLVVARKPPDDRRSRV
jgi:hypothetical protein